MKTSNGMNIILAVVICLVLVGVLIFISINNKVNMAPNNNIANNPPTNTISEGEIAKAGDMVSMNYTGRLENGTVFDSNVDPKFQHVEPFVFTLGAGQVIAGWDEGIVGMKVGEKRKLTIPPELAYGADGRPPVIPQSATLIFEIDMLSINAK